MQPDLHLDGRLLLVASAPDTNYRPTPAEYSWVTAALPSPPHQDPWVDYTARAVYDYHYNGAGNWPFNAAYAASRGLVADVTQLHNLREAEPFIKPESRWSPRSRGTRTSSTARSRARTATCW